jgi:peptidylprolyl isomerase
LPGRFDLAGALDVACNEVGGVIASASFDLERSAEWVEVVVFAKGSKHRLVIDAISGRVASDEIVDGEWTELPSGLKYFDIVVGEGAQPAGPTSTVTVHYTGWLVDGKKFDSSFDRGQPATFQLGRVIPGWTEGVGSMKVGGKRKLIIPYQLAYGEAGRRPVIPPKATLIFDVELLEITDEPATPPRE